VLWSAEGYNLESNRLAARQDGMSFAEKITHSLNQVKLQLEARFFALLMTLIALSKSLERSAR
jgi:hypothetical protein